MQTETRDFRAGISLREILSIGFRQRRLVLWAVVVPPVVAVLLFLVSHTYYRAEASLIVKTGREYLAPNEGTNALSAPTSTKQEEINSEIAILTSRGVISDALDRIGVGTLYPSLVSSPPMVGSVKDAAIELFSRRMDVKLVKLSNVVDVTFEDGSPERAAEALNDLIAAYQAKHVQVYAGERAQVYDQIIQRDVSDLDRLGAQRAELKVDNHIYDITQQRQALITELADARKQQDDANSRLVALKRRVGFLSGQHAPSAGSGGGTDADRNAQLVYAQNALIDLQRTETGMESRYAPDNPQLKQVQDQIAGVQARIQELGHSLSTVQADPASMAQQIGQSLINDQAELIPLADEIESYKRTITTVDAELQRLEKASNELDTVERRIAALSDDLKATRDRYDQARTLDDLDRAKVVSVAQINPVETPDKPSRPVLFLYLGIGLGAGVFAAGCVVFFSVAMHNTFICREDTERWLQLPVLVTVPKFDPSTNPSLRPVT